MACEQGSPGRMTGKHSENLAGRDCEIDHLRGHSFTLGGALKAFCGKAFSAAKRFQSICIALHHRRRMHLARRASDSELAAHDAAAKN
jgi:hypothetical protein